MIILAFRKMHLMLENNQGKELVKVFGARKELILVKKENKSIKNLLKLNK